jgi:hypothetical protein
MKRSVSSTTILTFCMHVADFFPFGKLRASAHRLRCAALGVFTHVADTLPSAAAILFILAVLGALPGHARAARVSGVLIGYENSTPLASRDLHFQNIVTGDAYLSPTHPDGSFRASLPPGRYRLRTETGAILVNSIMVGRADIDLGRVNELAPLAPQRWWQSQAIAPTQLAVPAPSTAYLMTSDTTPLPASATTVPKPEIDWSKPPPETEASQGSNIITGMAAAPIPPHHVPSATTASAPGWMGGAPYTPPLAPPGTSMP